jgi:hypothetical protein
VSDVFFWQPAYVDTGQTTVVDGIPQPSQSFSIAAAMACATIRVRQLTGPPVRFIVTDSKVSASPILVARGAEYCFLGPFAPGQSVGSITVWDWPDGLLFQFQQR